MSRKKWLSLDQQVELLTGRGLIISDVNACRQTLQRIGYYHMSGYWRFFQRDPNFGDNQFRGGVSFDDIAELQSLDSTLRRLCLNAIDKVEIALRSIFSYRFGQLIGSYERLQDAATYSSPPNDAGTVNDQVLRDLNRTNQHFVVRHRGNDNPYGELPVWIAVEVLSFGTLSKAIAYGTDDRVATHMADDLGLKRSGFSSQVRSFVALRNVCAHQGRIWNDVPKNRAAVQSNVLRRAKQRVGNFSDDSYFQLFVALDAFVESVDPSTKFLNQIESLMAQNQSFHQGLTNPHPYHQRLRGGPNP